MQSAKQIAKQFERRPVAFRPHETAKAWPAFAHNVVKYLRMVYVRAERSIRVPSSRDHLAFPPGHGYVPRIVVDVHDTVHVINVKMKIPNAGFRSVHSFEIVPYNLRVGSCTCTDWPAVCMTL